MPHLDSTLFISLLESVRLWLKQFMARRAEQVTRSLLTLGNHVVCSVQTNDEASLLFTDSTTGEQSMKLKLAAILAVVVLVFAGCGGSNTSNTTNTANTASGNK
jgi:hypothetical protein